MKKLSAGYIVGITILDAAAVILLQVSQIKIILFKWGVFLFFLVAFSGMTSRPAKWTLDLKPLIDFMIKYLRCS